MGNFNVLYLNQIICIAIALNEHGILLNLDDMQMGRLSPKLLGDINIVPISRIYPIQLTLEVKEKMKSIGIVDFWDYLFYQETKIRQEKKDKIGRRSRKRLWIF